MIAVDTNVLIYACDKGDPRRQKVALDLIATATDGVLPWQVACEFIAASRKLKDQGLTPEDAWDRLTDFLELFRLAAPSATVLPRARELHLLHQLSFWDALIVSACLEEGVETFYSEDIPGSDAFGPLKIINPFA